MLGLGINRLTQRNVTRGEAVAPFSIVDLFSGGLKGVWLDASDSSTLTASGGGSPDYSDSVATINDKSGNNNHVTFSVAPNYGRHPTSGLRNLLNDSDNFVSSYGSNPNARGWTPFGSNTSISTSTTETSPETGAGVARLYNTASANNPYVSIFPAGMNNWARSAGIYTASAYFKTNGVGTKPVVDILISFAGIVATYDVSAGTVSLAGATSKHISSSVTSAGNGWHLLKLTVDCASSDDISTPTFLGVDANGSYSSFANETAEYFLSAPQLELGTTRTAFQETATHYDVSQHGQSQVYYLWLQGAEYGSISDIGFNSGFDQNATVVAGIVATAGTPKQTIVHIGDAEGTDVGVHVHVDSSEIKNKSRGNSAVTVETSDVGGQIEFPLTTAIFASTSLSTSTTTVSLGSQGHEGTSSSSLGGSNFYGVGLQIGASNTDSTADTFFDGRIYQIIVVNKILTTDETNNVSSIIDDKVGV